MPRSQHDGDRSPRLFRPWWGALWAIAAAGSLGCARAGTVAVHPSADTAAVSDVLDALHRNAAASNEEAYFSLFAPDGVFLGTDATERWTVEQFRAYAHRGFQAGRGWTYVPRPGTRHITLDPTGTVAWFDELLDNASYGETRGTGVVRRVNGAWKISQYHLTIPVPNDLADEVVRMIRARR